MVAEHGCGPRECISERTDEQIVDESLEAARADLADTKKSSGSQDRNLLGTVEQIPDVLAPEMVEQLVTLPKTVSQNRTQQQTEEQVINAPVPQVVEELLEVSKVFSQYRVQQRFGGQIVEPPSISLAGKIDEVPVSETQEKTQQVANTHAQHVVNTVKVEKPKIIKQTMQKPVIQEKINQMTKHIDVPQLEFTDKVVDIPVVTQGQVHVNRNVQKTIEIHQLQCTDDVVDVPVVSVVQAPLVHVVAETAEIPQLPLSKKIVAIQGIDHETVMRDVVQNTGFDSFIDDLSSAESKGLSYQDCEVLFHVNKQSPDTAGGVHVGKEHSHGSPVSMLKWMSRCLRAGWHRVNECKSVGSTSSSTNHNNRQSRQCKQEKEGKEKRRRKVR